MPSIGRIVQIQLFGTVIDSDGVSRVVANSFCYRLATTGTGLPTKNDLAVAFDAKWAGGASLLSSQFVGNRYVVWYPMDAGDTPATVAKVPTNGGVATARLPLNQSVYLQFTTTTRGRSFYGRKHFAPIPIAHTTKDELTTLRYNQWKSFGKINLRATLFPNGALGSTWIPVVWSRKLSPATGSGSPAIGADVFDVFIDRTLGQLRHRIHRVGHKCGCCGSRLPLTLTATFDPIGCPSVAGKTYTLTYDPALGYWKVLFPGGAYPNDVDGVFFQCTNATTNCFQLKVTFLSGFQMNPPSLNNADVCYPFKCSFPVMTADFGHPCAAINSSAVVTA